MQRLLILLVATAAVAGARTTPPGAKAGGCEVEAPAIETSTTRELFAFPAGGTIEVTDSVGDVYVEGWDRSDVEVAVIKTMHAGDAERVDVTPLRAGAGRFLIATHLPESLRTALEAGAVTYRIKVPRVSHLLIRHDKGVVRVQGVSGNIDAMSYHGEMQFRLPNEMRYKVDAVSSTGGVVSEVESSGDGGVRELHLRTNDGGITIRRESKPREVTAGESMTD